jgi:hypothetical protein
MLETFLTEMNNLYDNAEKLLLEQPKGLQNSFRWLWDNTEFTKNYSLFINSPSGNQYKFESDHDLLKAQRATLERQTKFMNLFLSHFQ